MDKLAFRNEVKISYILKQNERKKLRTKRLGNEKYKVGSSSEPYPYVTLYKHDKTSLLL